ncbi:MAG: M48 family metallopeptidase [Candidatus Omnitrophota bacterium]|nr:M48 family metallopeptidase [Candidatus Omnitrophota bacterium]
MDQSLFLGILILIGALVVLKFIVTRLFKLVLLAILIGFSVFLFVGMSGCAYITPLVNDFNIVPLDQEIALGNNIAQSIAQEMKISDNAGMNGIVKAIGQELVNVLPRRDFDYKFYVVEDAAPNAFTIPGGSIYVHTGLLNFVDSPDELAGVIAHEVGHAYERHPAKSISRAYGLQYIGQMLSAKGDPGAIQQMAASLAGKGLLTKYGRSDEYEADSIGYYLTRRTHYESHGLVRFLEKLAKLSSGGGSIPFFQSHPPTPDRIARLKALAHASISVDPSASRL